MRTSTTMSSMTRAKIGALASLIWHVGLIGVLVAIILTISTSRSPAAAVERVDTERPFLRAAHWFGDGWPVNAWDTSLERRARRDFALIRADGFNTVVIVVPWPGFVPEKRSGELDRDRLRRLKLLIAKARQAGLRVVLRLGYMWDQGTEDSLDWSLALWSDPAVYAAWLDHFASMWKALQHEANLEFGFISWEDLWSVVSLGNASEPDRRRFARAVGYTEWLRGRYSLSRVEQQYETKLRSWDEVALPAPRSPGYGLLLEFVDAAWIDRFFAPARKRFSRLSMEVRLDEDPVWRGPELLRWHSHAAAWNLPGAEWTTVYWSPSRGGLNRGETLAPREAVRRLDDSLTRLATDTGGRPIFISQFLVDDATPGFEHNGRLDGPGIAAFLKLAGLVLEARAGGYGIWTWRDYAHDALGNPELVQGLNGWRHGDGVRRSSPGVRLETNGWIEAAVKDEMYHAGGTALPAELCVEGRALGSEKAQLVASEQVASVTLGRLSVGRNRTRACLKYARSPRARIRVRATAPMELTRIQAIGFVQATGIRDARDRPRSVRADYRALNAQLTKRRGVAPIPLAADGWMGRFAALTLARPRRGPLELVARTYLPANWPTRPRIAVTVAGQQAGAFVCGDSDMVRFPVPGDDDVPVDVRLASSAVHRVAGDGRELGCLVRELSLRSRQP